MERLGEVFTHTVVPLRYTPRKIEIHPETNYLLILEKDHNCFSYSEIENIKKQTSKDSEDEKYLELDSYKIGYPKGGKD